MKHFKILASILTCQLLSSETYSLAESSGDPAYIDINSCKDLQNISQADGHYQLTNDIDCSGVTFTPLIFPSQTNSSGPFTGTFNGNHYSIVNLNFSTESSNLALFSSSYGAEFSHLTLENITAQALPFDYNSKAAALVSNANATGFSNIMVRNIKLRANQMGAIAAYADVSEDTLFQNLHVRDGSFTLISIPSSGDFSESKVGGLFGYLGGLSTLSNSSAQVQINCEAGGKVNLLGGLVGETYQIIQSYSEIDINLNECNKVLFTGGIAGSAMKLRKVFSTGSMVAMNYQIQNSGGLLGILPDSGSIYDAYASVNIQFDNGGRVGAAIGKTKYGRLTNVLAKSVNGYIDNEHCLVGETYSPSLQGDILCWGDSPLQHYRENQFYSLDFFNTWMINEGLGLPTLRGFEGMLQLH